jgi:hypothetical protein
MLILTAIARGENSKMKTAIKSFVFGLIVGGLLAGWTAFNYGRNAPLFSNPFAQGKLKEAVKETTKEVVEETRGKIHDITKPAK